MSPPTGVSRCDCCSRHRPAGSRSRRRSRDRAETAPDSWEGKRGGVARDFCRPDREQQSCKHRVPRIGDEHGARGPRGSDLLCSPGVWVRGVPRLLLRAGSAVRTKAPRHCGRRDRPRRERCRSQLRAPGRLGLGSGQWARRSSEPCLRWLRPGATTRTIRLQPRLARAARTDCLAAHSLVARA